jgi:hypothetical protein|tara:strand:- start:810 stop:1130 length:321 start_codon:yes stop_codon:yes gene_type:complete
MANGRLGTADLAANTNTTVYTVPAANFAVVTLSMCNRSTTQRSIRVAVAAADTPTPGEYIEYDTSLVGNGTLERTGIVVNAGQKIVVFANSVDVSAVVYGLETATA